MSQSGRMTSRRRLPRGWSHPLKPGEVAACFPGMGSVTWNGRPQDWKAAAFRRVFRLEWSPRSAMPQPVLTVWAVPSADRAAIRAWIGATAMASMRAWLQAAEAAPQTWRDAEHNAAWHWPATGGGQRSSPAGDGPQPRTGRRNGRHRWRTERSHLYS
jgi:hypothetical protein